MKSDQDTTQFIFINGRGGSGKDTQANLLLQSLPGAVRISTGDIVRGSRDPQSPYIVFAPLFAPYLADSDKGGLIPDEVMLEAVDEVIRQHREAGTGTFIFTGFPRTEGQLAATDAYLASLGEETHVVADFLCHAVLDSHSEGRARNRRIEAERDGRTIRRDDQPEVVTTRLKEYGANTEPMLHRLTAEGRLRIVRSNGTIEQVHVRTLKALGLSLPELELLVGHPTERV